MLAARPRGRLTASDPHRPRAGSATSSVIAPTAEHDPSRALRRWAATAHEQRWAQRPTTMLVQPTARRQTCVRRRDEHSRRLGRRGCRLVDAEAADERRDRSRRQRRRSDRPMLAARESLVRARHAALREPGLEGGWHRVQPGRDQQYGRAAVAAAARSRGRRPRRPTTGGEVAFTPTSRRSGSVARPIARAVEPT